MLDPRTLRGRLTLGYSIALVAALLVFAAIALVVVDRTQRRLLDTSLAATASSVVAGLEFTRGRIELEQVDRDQFAAVVGARSAAIFDAIGNVQISSSANVPAAIARFARGSTIATYTLTQAGDERLRVYLQPIRKDGALVGSVAIWRDLESVGQLDTRLTLLFAFAIPLVAGVAILFGATVARRGLRPLERLATIASEIEAHDLTGRLDLPARSDELGRFAASFDRMLDRLQAAFARERQFTADASHELRAPLAVIRAEADLALRHERSGADYRQALETIAAEADALEAMTRDLLAVARADEPLAADARETELGAVITRTAERLRVLADSRGVALRVSVAPARAAIGERLDYERVVLSIAHNAVKFARSSVALALSADGNTLRLEIDDDGPGFSDSALTHAFERFWRDDEARSRDGTGLGLAIAHALIERLGGTIVLAESPSGGARVTLEIAAAP